MRLAGHLRSTTGHRRGGEGRRSWRVCDWAVQKHLQTLFNEGAVGALTDGELLERFVTRRGEAAEAAFAALVERHAPMVLATCRQILGDVHDAEDASQAAFLVLAKKARSIRSGQAIGGWLHAVAVRIASKAKVAAARRRKKEERSAEMAVHPADEPDRADRWAELHARSTGCRTDSACRSCSATSKG